MTCGCGIGHLAVCSSGKKLGTASSISATRKATIDVIFQRGKSSILVVRRLGATWRDRRQRGFDDLYLDAGGDPGLDDKTLDPGTLDDDPHRRGHIDASLYRGDRCLKHFLQF